MQGDERTEESFERRRSYGLHDEPAAKSCDVPHPPPA